MTSPSRSLPLGFSPVSEPVDSPPDPVSLAPDTSGSRSTDLVRLYLQDIGRVQLLTRDEEILEAQRVQAHVQLLAQRNALVADGGGIS